MFSSFLVIKEDKATLVNIWSVFKKILQRKVFFVYYETKLYFQKPSLNNKVVFFLESDYSNILRNYMIDRVQANAFHSICKRILF